MSTGELEVVKNRSDVRANPDMLSSVKEYSGITAELKVKKKKKRSAAGGVPVPSNLSSDSSSQQPTASVAAAVAINLTPYKSDGQNLSAEITLSSPGGDVDDDDAQCEGSSKKAIRVRAVKPLWTPSAATLTSLDVFKTKVEEYLSTQVDRIALSKQAFYIMSSEFSSLMS